MGVPSVALLGDYLNGRVSASVLATIGCGQFVAVDGEDYVETAVRLAQTQITLTTRQMLRDRLLGSVIGDPKAYTQATEAVYRQAWRSWVTERAARPALQLVSA